jgi:hypothetical protein
MDKYMDSNVLQSLNHEPVVCKQLPQAFNHHRGTQLCQQYVMCHIELTGDHNLKGLDTQKIANMCDLYTRKLHSSRLKITKVGDYDYTYSKDHNRFKRGGRNQNVSYVFQGVLRGALKM